MGNIESRFNYQPDLVSGDSIAPENIRNKIFNAIPAPDSTQFWFGQNKHDKHTIGGITKGQVAIIVELYDTHEYADERNEAILKYLARLPSHERGTAINQANELLQKRLEAEKRGQTIDATIAKIIFSPLTIARFNPKKEVGKAIKILEEKIIQGITEKGTGYTDHNGTKIPNGEYGNEFMSAKEVKLPDNKWLMTRGVKKKDADDIAKGLARRVSGLCGNADELSESINTALMTELKKHGY